MTSSSKRIIKRPDVSGDLAIENYLPPLEQLMSSREVIPQPPVFPRYTLEGMRKQEPDPGEPEEVLPEAEKEQPDEDAGAAGDEPEEAKQKESLAEEWEEERLRLLEEAERKARQILEEAEREADRKREEAAEEGRREGYEAGYREGRQKAEEEFREGIQDNLLEFQADMKRALKAVDTAKENCLHAYLEELKDCAVAVGEKVIHISLKSSGEVIKQMIVSATEKLKKTAWVKIYIDKYDYDMMMAADAGVMDELSHLSDNIKFIVMDKEDRGSCIIEMPEEIVDVSVNTQIENIKDILENVRL